MSNDNGAPQVAVNVQQSPPAVTITLGDIYEKLVVVETKLAPILDPDVGVVARQRDHEGRLRELEQEVVRKDELSRVRTQTVAIVTLMLLILGSALGLIQAVGA